MGVGNGHEMMHATMFVKYAYHWRVFSLSEILTGALCITVDVFALHTRY